MEVWGSGSEGGTEVSTVSDEVYVYQETLGDFYNAWEEPQTDHLHAQPPASVMNTYWNILSILWPLCIVFDIFQVYILCFWLIAFIEYSNILSAFSFYDWHISVFM